MSNSLRDIKTASSKRQIENVQESDIPVEQALETKARSNTVTPDQKTKTLAFRVPYSIHREFQRQLFEAQEHYPELTAQETMPALVRLLRDREVWKKFINELEK